MSTGQMFLVTGAIVLFAIVSLSATQAIIQADQVDLEARVGGLAASVAHERIEDLLAVPFDSLAIGASVDSVRTPLITFVCSTRVSYVEDLDPEVVVGGPTPFKRISATVWSAASTVAVTLAAVAGDM